MTDDEKVTERQHRQLLRLLDKVTETIDIGNYSPDVLVNLSHINKHIKIAIRKFLNEVSRS